MIIENILAEIGDRTRLIPRKQQLLWLRWVVNNQD